MEEKEIRKYLRRSFRPLGWSLTAYYVIMNIMVMMTVAVDSARLGLESLSGGKLPDQEALMEASLQNAWGYLVTIAVGLCILLAWKGWDFFRKVFLEGGTIDEKVFTGNYEEAIPQLAEKLAPYGFREIVAKGGGLAAETGKYTLLEKLCDDMRIRYLADAKYITAGPEPIAAFYLAKESEIKNLRMILTGKLSKTPEETMKERLRETYV